MLIDVNGAKYLLNNRYIGSVCNEKVEICVMEKKQNNQLVNILVNIVIPIVILTKFSKEAYLGPLWGLVIALAFPLVFGLYGLFIQKQKNFISVLGFIGVLLSGVIGLFKFPPEWVAIKEASIPLIIGIVVLISTKTPWQLLKTFIYNREILDIDNIESRLTTPELRSQLSQKLNRANVYLACSFGFSAVLNYVLAKIIVQSMPGTIEFNEEIGRMAMLSFPVIALPSVILMVFILKYILSSLKSLTQLSTDEIFAEKFRDKKKENQ